MCLSSGMLHLFGHFLLNITMFFFIAPPSFIDCYCIISLESIYFKPAHNASCFQPLTTAWRRFDTMIRFTSVCPTHRFCAQHKSVSCWILWLLWSRKITTCHFTTTAQTLTLKSMFKPTHSSNHLQPTEKLIYWLSVRKNLRNCRGLDLLQEAGTLICDQW